MKDEQLVDTKKLASELGVTVRRVRQMVEEHILPPPRDGKHDLARCERRYRLYKRGADADWNAFYDEVEEAAKDAAKKFERALKRPAGVPDDAAVIAAAVAHQRNVTDLRFLTACKSRSAAERKMFLDWWDREDDQAMGMLLAHAMAGKTLVDAHGTALYRG
jgi:hypothetical protein